MSDDLAMGALAGAPAARARAALAAGCDLALFCTGDLAQGAAVLDAAGPAEPAVLARLDAARPRPDAAPFDPANAAAELDGLLAGAAVA